MDGFFSDGLLIWEEGVVGEDCFVVYPHQLAPTLREAAKLIEAGENVGTDALVFILNGAAHYYEFIKAIADGE